VSRTQRGNGSARTGYAGGALLPATGALLLPAAGSGRGNGTCVKPCGYGARRGAAGRTSRLFSPVSTATRMVTELQVQANRLELFGRLADDLAHEIKNPLHAIVINLELVRRRVVQQQAQGALERAAIVEEELHRAHDLIDQTLHLFRPARAEERAFDADSVLREMEPLLVALCRVARARLRLVTGADRLVPMQRSAFKHALLNLVENGLEAMAPAGGELRIRTSAEGGEFRLRVEDEGCGVAADLAEGIWVPGRTTRNGRSGLGLAVARALVEAAGGRLDLEAGNAAGATFVIGIPAPVRGAADGS
jgi:two-component system, NtrC family, C4-dicarboxylate transport sensor histidine kinase DctB